MSPPLTLKDVVEVPILQDFTETLARLTNLPLFFATPGGEVLARSGAIPHACAALASTEAGDRPCLECPRTRLDPDGWGWPEGDIAEALPCEMGLSEVMVPVRVEGQVLGLIGSSQVVLNEQEREHAEALVRRLDYPRERAEAFFASLRMVTLERLEVTRESVASMASLFATMGVRAAREQQLRHRFEALSQKDPLTGVGNRREGMARLKWGLSAAASRGAPLAVLMMDLDRFKQLNDTFGHAAGDAVLRQFCDVVEGAVRGGDRLFRMGGEEFILVCFDCDARAAAHVAERVRAAVAGHDFGLGGQRVTVSVGVCVAAGRELPTVEGALAEADRAMYDAKAGGRDRVVMAAPPPPPLSRSA